jgi:small subunit ribosomal protein S9
MAQQKAVAPKAAKVSMPPIAHGVGRRKSAVARAWLRRGAGRIIVNGIDFKNYFDTDHSRRSALMPFLVCPVGTNYDVEINLRGGGKFGQADAVKLAIARAFVEMDETLRPVLRQHGLLTVDDRLKERKKYGQKAARRKFQFVKR